MERISLFIIRTKLFHFHSPPFRKYEEEISVKEKFLFSS